MNWNKKNATSASLIAALSCLPITGFSYGFMICSDCGTGLGSVLGRSFLGLIYAGFTTITLGKPWTGSGAVMSSANLRPYVLLAFFLIFTVAYVVLYKRTKALSQNDSKKQ